MDGETGVRRGRPGEKPDEKAGGEQQDKVQERVVLLYDNVKFRQSRPSPHQLLIGVCLCERGACMRACMYACMHVCVYVCMHACVY